MCHTYDSLLLPSPNEGALNAHVCNGFSGACHSAHEDIPRRLCNHHLIQTSLQSPPLIVCASKLEGDMLISQDQLIQVFEFIETQYYSQNIFQFMMFPSNFCTSIFGSLIQACM